MATKFGQDLAYNKQNPATGNAMADEGEWLNDEQLWSKYKRLVDLAITNSSTWRSKQEQWHKQRMRFKKKKVFPHPDCSNLKMPTDERHIRKKKAKLVNRIFGIRPIVQAVPPPSGRKEVALKIEKFMDHLIMDCMEFYPQGVIAIDKMLEGGFQCFKPYWKIETTKREEVIDIHDMSLEEVAMFFSHGTDPDWIKDAIVRRLDIDMNPLVAEENERVIEEAIVRLYQGDETFSIQVEDVVYNAPAVALPDSSRVYVPSESPINPQDCEWICHELEISYREFLNRAERGYKNIDKVSASVRQTWDPNFNLDQIKANREGIEIYQRSGHVRVWEIFAWEKLLPSDTFARKCVITIAPDFGIVLRRISLDILNGRFPISRINNELIDNRWYSPRGIPEIITDIVKEIDTQKNQRIDSQTARNAPMFLYRVGIVNPNSRLRPNKGIPVPAGVPFEQVFQMVNNTNLNAEFSYKDEAMQLNAETEELLGEINFTLQSQINKRQPRTGVEVAEHVQGVAPAATLEGDTVSFGFGELFRMIFALWCQHGDDEYEFQYFGESANGKFETIKLRKEELQGHVIVVRGNDSNTNPQVRLQKAFMIQQAVSEPLGLQMGITTPMNIYNAKRAIFQELGQNPDDYVSPPPPPPPPKPLVDEVKIKMEDLQPIEKAQVLSSIGIKPDLRGHIEDEIFNRKQSAAELKASNDPGTKSIN